MRALSSTRQGDRGNGGSLNCILINLILKQHLTNVLYPNLHKSIRCIQQFNSKTHPVLAYGLPYTHNNVRFSRSHSVSYTRIRSRYNTHTHHVYTHAQWTFSYLSGSEEKTPECIYIEELRSRLAASRCSEGVCMDWYFVFIFLGVSESTVREIVIVQHKCVHNVRRLLIFHLIWFVFALYTHSLNIVYASSFKSFGGKI